MKNIIFIILALVIGVAETWGQDIQTFTAGRWQSPSVEGSTTSIPIAVQDNAVVFYRVNHGVTVNISAITVTSDGTININASGRTGAQPAIFLPESATLVITGDGTINLTGGNAADGVKGSLISSDGGNGGGGAAPGIGGKGGTGGQGGVSAGDSKYGTLGTGMGKLYILGNVTVNVKKGKEGESKVGTATVGGGDGGKTPQYAIGGGGRGGNSKDGESSASSSPYFNQTPNNGYIFIQNTATVTYKNGQGAADTSRPDVQTEPTLKALSDVGYTFKGYRVGETWVIDEYGIYVDGGSGFDKSISVLDERWTKTITLDQQGGTGGSTSVEVAYGCPMKAATAPTIVGYDFKGYFTEPNGGGTQYYDADMSSTHNWDINTNQNTLYAHWTANQYTVSFNPKGGSPSPESITVTYDDTYGTLPTVTRTGYTFEGWFTEETSGTEVTPSIKVQITDAQTLYAHWTANQYTVSFNPKGGSPSPNNITVTYDDTYGTLPTVTRTGYTFDGWFTEETSGTEVTSSTTANITDAQTLYAHWTANTYTVNFNSQKGESASPITVTYDGTYAELPDITRYGFEFDGWYTDATSGTKIRKTDVVDILAETTLYAHWNPIQVDIETYSVDTQLRGNYFRTFYDSQVAHVLPPGTTAYKGRIESEYLMLTKIEAKDDDDNDIIPKNVPVILRIEPNEAASTTVSGYPTVKKKTISLTTSEYVQAFDNSDNELSGTDEDITSAPSNSYIFSYGSKGLGFYEWGTHALEAHKAYVVKNPENPARALIFHFEDDVTGINDAITDFKADNYNEAIYNLNGIRLSKPQKGINIINGKKIWVK